MGDIHHYALRVEREESESFPEGEKQLLRDFLEHLQVKSISGNPLIEPIQGRTPPDRLIWTFERDQILC